MTLGRALAGCAALVVMTGGVTAASAASYRSAATVDARATRVEPAIRVAPPPPPPITADEQKAREVLDVLNDYRRAHGLADLEWHPRIAEASARFAAELASRDTLSHTGLDGSSPGDRLRAAGFDASNWAENVGMGHSSARAIVDAWAGSAGHDVNLRADMRYAGVGVGTDASGSPYWVLDIADPR